MAHTKKKRRKQKEHKITDRQRKLIFDCIVSSLTEKQALEYLKKMHEKMAVATYYRYKAFVQSDDELKSWLAEYAKTGFVRVHQELIKQIENLIEKMNILLTEAIKNHENIFIIEKLVGRLESLNKRRAELNLGNPIIAAVKAKIDLSVKAEGDLNITTA